MDEEILEQLKVESADEKLRRYKSNWLRHVTRLNNNRAPKIMLNYRSKGRRKFGIPFKRLLNEDETRDGLLLLLLLLLLLCVFLCLTHPAVAARQFLKFS
jgi:hypothetical protein